MAQEVKVPDIGNYSNIPVIEILVKPGETVKKDQGLVTLESDKATMEVPAPFAGVVAEIKVKVGDEVSEGVVVVLIDAVDGAPAPARSEAPVVAESTKPGIDAEIAGPRTPPVPFDASVVMPDKVAHASPAVRLFARELGVDLMRVAGSGRKSRITKEDVQNFVKQALAGGTAAPRAAAGCGGAG